MVTTNGGVAEVASGELKANGVVATTCFDVQIVCCECSGVEAVNSVVSAGSSPVNVVVVGDEVSTSTSTDGGGGDYLNLTTEENTVVTSVGIELRSNDIPGCTL